MLNRGDARYDVLSMLGAFRIAFIFATLLFGSGCTSLRYVTQAAAGQYELVARAEDIDVLVREKRVTPRTRRLLAAIPAMKRFGEARGLKATTNYTTYVNLNRPYVVWVVTASEPLAFASKTWSFPLVGSFNYLGWFKEADARAFARDLSAAGWDIDVRGSPAYSTTGFFKDPVLSTMIPDGPHVLGELASTILHESTHATVFVHNQSILNESIANFVGDHMAVDFLDAVVGKGSKEEREFVAVEAFFEKRGASFHQAVIDLEALYASALPDPEKLAKKEAILADLKARTHYSRPITNATLIQYRTYHSGKAELATLFTRCDGDWTRFVARLKTLEKASFTKKQEKEVGPILAKLAEAPCALPIP